MAVHGKFDPHVLIRSGSSSLHPVNSDSLSDDINMDVIISAPDGASTKHGQTIEGVDPLGNGGNRDAGLKNLWNRFIWHGGSNYDAWFNAVSGQVGQVILTMPTSYAQMGFGLGIFFHLLYAGVGIWTCYLLASLYLEYRSRKEKQGTVFKMHVIQVIGVFSWLVDGHFIGLIIFACFLLRYTKGYYGCYIGVVWSF